MIAREIERFAWALDIWWRKPLARPLCLRLLNDSHYGGIAYGISVVPWYVVDRRDSARLAVEGEPHDFA